MPLGDSEYTSVHVKHGLARTTGIVGGKSVMPALVPASLATSAALSSAPLAMTSAAMLPLKNGIGSAANGLAPTISDLRTSVAIGPGTVDSVL